MSNLSHSVSRIPIELTLNDNEVVIAELVRHLSPLTIRKVINSIPISGIIHEFGDSFIYIKTDFEIGSEKGSSQFNRGDIAFSPSNGFICVFIRKSVIAQKFNLIGRVLSNNLDLFLSIHTGDRLSIKKSVSVT